MNTQSPTTRTPPPTHNNHLGDDNNSDDGFRDIHALTPPSPPPLPVPPSRHQRVFDASSRRSSNLSVSSDITNSSENFTTMSREFNALVLAGSAISPNNDYYTSNQLGWNNGNGSGNGNGNDRNNNNINLDRIGEEEGEAEEINPLAIVPDINPMPSPPDGHGIGSRNHSSLGHLMGPSSSSNNNSNSNSNSSSNNTGGAMAVHNVKKEEVETKIAAWQTAKVSKINNRFKREDAIISGWENEQVHKATSWMKKVERKLEEKRAKAMEKMQNDIAKAHRKAEERRASAEGKRGTKVAKVLEVANLMRAVGRPPAKRSFF